MSKLLIVDDDIRLRKLVRTYGEVEHYECDEAADGLAALEKLQVDNFDLVILDVMMPGLDGFETLERIRKTSEIPVIMLTARNEEYDKLTGFGLGVDDYVSKPFSPKELMARVGAVLKRNGKKSAVLSYQYKELEIHPDSRTASISGRELFYPQLGVKLCSMAGGGVQKIYMVFLREPSRRDRSGSDLFHLRDGFEIKMNFDRNVSCFIFVNALMHDDFFD